MELGELLKKNSLVLDGFIEESTKNLKIHSLPVLV
jgi:hypothetical protein